MKRIARDAKVEVDGPVVDRRDRGPQDEDIVVFYESQDVGVRHGEFVLEDESVFVFVPRVPAAVGAPHDDLRLAALERERVNAVDVLPIEQVLHHHVGGGLDAARIFKGAKGGVRPFGRLERVDEDVVVKPHDARFFENRGRGRGNLETRVVSAPHAVADDGSVRQRRAAVRAPLGRHENLTALVAAVDDDGLAALDLFPEDRAPRNRGRPIEHHGHSSCSCCCDFSFSLYNESRHARTVA